MSREAQPTIELGLSEMATVEQIEALKASRIDIGFGGRRIEDNGIPSAIV